MEGKLAALGSCSRSPNYWIRLRGFFIPLAPHLAVTAAHDRPQRAWGNQVWLQQDEVSSLRGGGGWRGLGPKSAFAFKTQKSSLWRSGAVLPKEVELPGCSWWLEQWWRWEWCLGAQKAALCFGGGRRKTNPAHQDRLNQNRDFG